MMRSTALLFFAFLAAAPAAAANESVMPSLNDGQVEVTADESLEWYQDTRLYVARGNAKATRGAMTITADLLSAHERDKGAENRPGAGGIDKLTAEGHVQITDPRQQAFGDRAVYDFDRKIAIMTGGGLKYVTARDIVTARDSLEYHEEKNMAIARGKAVAVRDTHRIEGDLLAAHFTQTPSGQMEMSRMTATGNVAVLTAQDVARGDRAVYDLKRNVAVLTGNVRVTRAGTQLAGDRAEVDFASGQSRLLNEGKGRVRALLTPKSGATVQGAPSKGGKGQVDTDGKEGQKAVPKAITP